MPVVIGVDPGLASTGYGVIDAAPQRLRWIDHGVIRTPAGDTPGSRLVLVADGISRVIEQHAPSQAGVESLYFTKNVSSAIPVAQARGVVLMLLERAGVPAREFTPQVIKQAVVGTGQASKDQVSSLVQLILSMPQRPKPDHAADALAAAITCWNAGAMTNVQ